MNSIIHIYSKYLEKCSRNIATFSIIFIAIITGQSLYASHIVGGDLQYKCLGNNMYELRLTILRDCFNGSPEAEFDEHADIWIYDSNMKPISTIGSPKGGAFTMNFVGKSDTLFDISDDPCYTGNLGVLCVEKYTYVQTFRLPYREGGYHLAYFRCCRNTLIQNIHDPLITGSTYAVQITDQAMEVCNSGPEVKGFPTLYVCRGKEFSFDQSSFDEEGDSLVYYLCDPYSGLTKEDPREDNIHPEFPYGYVDWIDPIYSLQDMMGNPDNPVTISRNGILSGTPMRLGTFLVGFCIEEYRNGELLTKINRDYEITVLPCENIPVAAITEVPDVNCDGTEIQFGNGSENATDYKWYFDYANDTTQQSTEFEPKYNYPDTGCYEVVLIASNSVCADTLIRTICVYENTLDIAFNILKEECESDLKIILEDISVDTVSPIVSREWEVVIGSDRYTDSGVNVTIDVDNAGTAIVTLTVTTANGCQETISKEIEVDFTQLDLVGDSLLICRGKSTPLLNNGDPDLEYEWTPTTGLDLTNPHNPIASPVKNTWYYVTVTSDICYVVDSIFVEVVGTDFEIVDLSDSCNVLKRLTVSGIDFETIEWATDPDFNNVISREDTVEVEVTDQQTIYVKIFEPFNNCELTDSITIKHSGLVLEFAGNDRTFCQGEAAVITVRNNNNLEWSIVWDENEIILSGNTEKEIQINTEDTITTTIYFTATAENSCITRDSINIKISEKPTADFDFVSECGNLTVEFENTSSEGEDVSWDFGDGNRSDEENPTHTYSETGDYEVMLVVGVGDCFDTLTKDVSVVEIDVNLSDTLYSCDGEPVSLNPGGSSEYEYMWEPEEFLDDASSANPTATVENSTTFFVTITTPNDTCVLLDTVHVEVVRIDLEALNDSIAVCTMDSVTLMGATSHEPITWTDEQGNVVGVGNKISVKPGSGKTTYTATVEHNGCMETRTATIEIIDLNNFITAIATPDSIELGDTSQLDVEGLDDTYTYSWSPEESLSDPNIRNPKAFPIETTTYCVTVTDNEGCVGESCVTVEIRDQECIRPFIFLPNAFSPNGDGENDVLYLYGVQVDEMHLMIYNRWGEKVFESKDQKVGWDGMSKGNPQPDDTYGYYLRVLCENGEELIERGNVSLLR